MGFTFYMERSHFQIFVFCSFWGWPWTRVNPPAIASWVIGLLVCTAIPGSLSDFAQRNSVCYYFHISRLLSLQPMLAWFRRADITACYLERHCLGQDIILCGCKEDSSGSTLTICFIAKGHRSQWERGLVEDIITNLWSKVRQYWLFVYLLRQASLFSEKETKHLFHLPFCQEDSGTMIRTWKDNDRALCTL